MRVAEMAPSPLPVREQTIIQRAIEQLEIPSYLTEVGGRLPFRTAFTGNRILGRNTKCDMCGKTERHSVHAIAGEKEE